MWFYTSSQETAVTNGHGVIIPCDPANTDYARLIESGAVIGSYVAPPPAPPPPRQIAKADIWRRATDAEAEILDGMLNAQPVRLRRMWADAQYLATDDELYATVETALVQTFGATRAAQLLA